MNSEKQKQLEAIRLDSTLIEGMDNPCEEAIELALEFNPYNLIRIKVPLSDDTIKKVLVEHPYVAKDPRIEPLLTRELKTFVELLN